jgi:hypothetical protein
MIGMSWLRNMHSQDIPIMGNRPAGSGGCVATRPG